MTAGASRVIRQLPGRRLQQRVNDLVMAITSVSSSNSIVLGTAPIVSVGLVEMAMASSLGLVMYNAMTAERNSQLIQNAGVSQCCALMIAAGAAGAAK